METMLTGIAKPTPLLELLDVVPVSIWALTPMTSPARFKSGPPELVVLTQALAGGFCNPG
jgi:hypothetical protein